MPRSKPLSRATSKRNNALTEWLKNQDQVWIEKEFGSVEYWVTMLHAECLRGIPSKSNDAITKWLKTQDLVWIAKEFGSLENLATMLHAKYIKEAKSKRIDAIIKELETLDLARIAKEFGSVENLATMLHDRCLVGITSPAQYQQRLNTGLARLAQELARPADKRPDTVPPLFVNRIEKRPVESHTFQQEVTYIDSDVKTSEQPESLPNSFAKHPQAFFQSVVSDSDSDASKLSTTKEIEELCKEMDGASHDIDFY